MKKGLCLLVAVMVSFVLLGLNSYAFALGSGGFRNEAALDAEANGKAAAFVAQADSPSAVHFNPAGLVQLDGNNVRIGYTYEAPRNFHSDTSGVESKMQREAFYIPNFYFVTDMGSEDLRFGLSATSPYGLSTDWADDSFSRYQATESSLEFYQLNPTVAYKVNDVLSLGFGIDYMTSHISKHKRMAAVLGEGDFQLKGDDDAWGYNIGVLVRPSDRHSIGLSYRSEIELKYKGVMSVNDLSATAQALYSFPSSHYTTDIRTNLTLPKTVAAGYAFKPNDRLTVEVDCEWTGWSSIQEDSVTYPNEGNASRLSLLNSGNPASKDWNDSLAYGIGAEYEATDKLELRCGYLFYQNPIPAANFDTSLPDSDRHGFTLGCGYKLKDNLTLDASYFGVVYVERDVTNDVATASGADLDGKYDGYMNIISVGLTYKY
jgi:long-chain fatty acid transport protein